MKKYKIITFGCPSNISDSERVATTLEGIDYKESEENPDIVVINICSIRQSAVDRAQSKIKHFKSLGIKTIITGCILDKDRAKLEKLANLAIKIKDISKLPELLNSKCKDKKKDRDYFDILPKHHDKYSALIPIMTGCNNYCTFCVVPYVRGREYSRPTLEILNEVKSAISSGRKEIWLLGQNVNSYKDKNINFSSLLKKVVNISGNFWIRFLSSNPKDLTSELIQTIKSEEKITEYLNIPVQSGDDNVLKMMNRSYKISEYKKSIKSAIKEIPEITLSTDAIVGFPGESREAFQNTVNIFKNIKFDMAYISKYSPRFGTPAFEMKNQIPYKEKNRRFKELTEVLKKTALKKNKKLIGQEIDIFVHSSENGLLIGRSKNYKLVKFLGPKTLIGTFIKIKIKEASPWRLIGSIK